MPQDWTMPRRSDRCMACQHEFAAGETFCACLYDTPAGYQRRDFCPTCPPPTEPPPVGSWKTRRPDSSAGGPRATIVIDKAALLAVFEQLAEATDRQKLQFRFVLALLLWRKRALKLEGTRDESGVEFWDFGDPRTGTAHAVARPELDESELERLSNELETLITGGAGSELLGGTAAPTEALP